MSFGAVERLATQGDETSQNFGLKSLLVDDVFDQRVWFTVAALPCDDYIAELVHWCLSVRRVAIVGIQQPKGLELGNLGLVDEPAEHVPHLVAADNLLVDVDFVEVKVLVLWIETLV